MIGWPIPCDENKSGPFFKNIEHVQFSLPIQMAFTLLGYGNGYRVHHDYLEGKIDMDKVIATAHLFEIEVTPELDDQYPGKFVADVTVNFKDGKSERVFVADSAGTPEKSMPESEQHAKFMDLTGGVLGEARATALMAALCTLDTRMTVAELTAMCAA